MRTGEGSAGYRQGSALMRRGAAIALVLAAAIASILVLPGEGSGVALGQDASAVADAVAGPDTSERRYESLRSAAIIAVAGLVALVVALTLIVGFLALRHRRVVREFQQLAALEGAHGDEIDEAHRQASERETELRAVLDIMVDGVLTIDAHGRVLSCNPATQRLLGYAGADLLQLDIRRLFFDSDGEDLFAFIVNDGSAPPGSRPDSRHGEVTGITRYGRMVPLDTSLSEMQLAGRRQFVLILRDLSARKSALARINEIENRLINAINVLPDGFVIYDQDDRLVMCNQKYREIYSRSSDIILVGRKFEDILRESVRRGQYAGAARDPELWIAERLRRHRGSTSTAEQELSDGRCLRIIEQRTPDGGTVGFRVDITELKRREAALQRSEGLLRATVFGAFEGIIVTDETGKVLTFNPAAESIFGYTAAEAAGANVYDLLLPEPKRSRYKAGLADFLETGHGPLLDRRWETECLRKDLSIVLVEVAVTVSESADGQLFIANVRDITEEKARAQALEEARHKAEVASRAKASFLAVMSHEIRTPLNGVLGLLDLLAATGLDDKQRAYVETAGESAQALLAIINDVLVFSKMEAGKLDLEPEPGSLSRLVDGVESLMAPRAAERGLTLTVSLADAIPDLVWVDMGRLRQVLLNLVGNALKFTEAGTVSIELSRVGAREARGVNGGTHRFRFAVRDTGIGFPADKIPDLFAEFATLDSSYSRRYEGTGLGLAICRELVTRMGGHIGVESTPGEGSTFYFELQLREAPAAPERAQAGMSDDAAVARLKGTRILLAEDNATNRMVVSEMLGGIGCSVSCANTGREAIDRIRAEPFDAVLMDISMPEMDGEQATRVVRSMGPPVGRIPIIALTAHALAMDRDRIQANGMDAFLSKPVSRHDLVTTLAAVLEAGGGPDCAGRTAVGRPSAPIAAIEAPGMVASAASSPAPVVDETVLTALLTDIPPQMRRRIVVQFQSDTRERLVQLADGMTRGDVSAIGHATHALTSLLGTFGAVEAAGLSAKIDEQVRLGARIADLDLVPELLNHAEGAIAAVIGFGEREDGIGSVVSTMTGDR